ncbi:hypothetical protein TIFTF001_018914 [Ficus carica]|uniref:Uncharacterized protein n=1 Tax=Ficus carica TaxID=3494 RepID=A0AA88A5F2_FICCA|nr:hypothetical protein TIFTF001_018914 [Ficus carica]
MARNFGPRNCMLIIVMKIVDFAPLICILIMVIDIVAGILGIQAEIAENKVKHLRLLIFECRDPSYQAYKLGMAAAILLALAHVIANSLGGCICFLSRDDNNKATANKQLAVGSLILSCIEPDASLWWKQDSSRCCTFVADNRDIGKLKWQPQSKKRQKAGKEANREALLNHLCSSSILSLISLCFGRLRLTTCAALQFSLSDLTLLQIR